MTDTLQEKIIDNQICAYNGCRRSANVRVSFSLGFSARFCNKCAEILTKGKIVERKPEPVIHDESHQNPKVTPREY